MREGSSSSSVKVSRTAFLVGFFAAAVVLALHGIQAGNLLVAAVLALFFVNIFLFTTNAFKALSEAKGKSEAALETLVVPALRGEPNVLTQRLKDLCTYAVTFCLGIAMSAILFLVLRHYRVLH